MREKLLKPILKGEISFEEALFRRRSIRSFQVFELSKQQLSQLLWAAYGITHRDMLKTVPSAGATYPLEIYYLDKDGIFHYIPEEHSIELIKKGDFRKKLSEYAYCQIFIAEASINIIICALYDRTTLVYGKERGYKYVLIEVGHCAQNICLQAVTLGLESVCVGAFDEQKVKELLMINEDLMPIYIVTIGKRK